MKVNEDFHDILKSVNKNAINKLEKYLSEIINIKKSYTEIIKENEKLEIKLSNINNNVRTANNQLIQKNDEVSKWQIKFQSFKKIMPFFEELIRQYPEEDPIKLINKYLGNKKILLDQLHKLNSLKEEYEDIFNQKEKMLKFENLEKESIEERINEEKRMFEERKKILDQEINLYQTHYDNIQIINERKTQLKQNLFNLYKKIKGLVPEKNYNIFIKKIGFNPIKNEEDFDPTIFNNKYFMDLIKEFIVNKASQCIDGKLLRNTIVFGNYLSRKYLYHNKNKNYRYDPVNSFRDLKNLIDNIKFDNNRLKAMVINLKQKQIDLKTKRKNLEYLMNKRKMEYNELLSKLEKAKKIQLTIFKSKNNKLKSLEKIESNKNLIKSKSNKNLKIEINNKDDLFKTIDNYKNTKEHKFFITNTDRVLKINKKSMKNKFKNKVNKYLINKTEKNKNNNTIKKENDNLKEIMKKFKNLKRSKNKDKLYKTNGFNSAGNIFLYAKNIIKELREQENLYSFKYPNEIKNKIIKNKLTIETFDDFPTILEYKKNELKKYKTIQSKRPFSSQMYNGDNYEIISNKILTNIDNIIDKIKGLKPKNLTYEENAIISSLGNTLKNKENSDQKQNINNYSLENFENNEFSYNNQSKDENNSDNDTI